MVIWLKLENLMETINLSWIWMSVVNSLNVVKKNWMMHGQENCINLNKPVGQGWFPYLSTLILQIFSFWQWLFNVLYLLSHFKVFSPFVFSLPYCSMPLQLIYCFSFGIWKHLHTFVFQIFVLQGPSSPPFFCLVLGVDENFFLDIWLLAWYFILIMLLISFQSWRRVN